MNESTRPFLWLSISPSFFGNFANTRLPATSTHPPTDYRHDEYRTCLLLRGAGAGRHAMRRRRGNIGFVPPCVRPRVQRETSLRYAPLFPLRARMPPTPARARVHMCVRRGVGGLCVCVCVCVCVRARARGRRDQGFFLMKGEQRRRTACRPGDVDSNNRSVSCTPRPVPDQSNDAGQCRVLSALAECLATVARDGEGLRDAMLFVEVPTPCLTYALPPLRHRPGATPSYVRARARRVVWAGCSGSLAVAAAPRRPSVPAVHAVPLNS